MRVPVQIHLLRQRIGERSQCRLRGRVRRVACEREESQEGSREDEMAGFRGARRVRFARFGGGLKPGIEDSVRHVGRGEVIGVHLALELRC